MGISSLLHGKRRRTASVSALASISLAAAALAFQYDGLPAADLDLNDGGVWVTKQSDLLVGHLNFPSRVLDAGLRTKAPQYDVLQQGDTVLVHDSANATLTQIDPARVTLLGSGSLPAGAAVSTGSDTAAILADGDLYAVPVGSIDGLRLDGAEPLAKLGAGAVATIGLDGVIHAFSPTLGEVRDYAPKDKDYAQKSARKLAELPKDAKLSIAAVGADAVMFDSNAGDLYLPGGQKIAIADGKGGSLQENGQANDRVLVSTLSALVAQPLAGGSATVTRAPKTSTNSAPAAPVWLNGCAYAAWSGTSTYLRDCGAGKVESGAVPNMPANAQLVFRVNRDVVVLNDIQGGGVWLVTQKMLLVQNWNDVVPPPDVQDDQEEKSPDQQVTLPKRTEQNHPPVAVDQQFGVRAGRTSLLRVTEECSDPDGDVLAAALAGSAPPGVEVQPALGGAALQVSVPASASGSLTFRYRVDDGRGGTAEANLTLAVRPAGQNSPPELKRPQSMKVESGATLQQDALQGWRDPDGDEMYLKSATTDSGDRVTFRNNGIIDFAAVSGQTGVKEVKLIVSDGTADAEGLLRVEVLPKGSLRPIANADRMTAVASTPLTMSPLLNDISTSGAALRLAKYDQVPGASITADFTAGTITFQMATPGTYYMQYLVTDGPNSAVGLIRIDVLPGSGTSRPVAVRDVALVPVGRSALVDVLANDSDAAGGILIVQSVEVPAGTGVTAEVLENRVIRVTDMVGLSHPVTFRYTVSNGAEAATGEVLVLPVPLPATLRPPVTVDDTATVRTGDVVTVDVLHNDYHPDGDTLTLRPDLVAPEPTPAEGTAFISGDKLRFRAGQNAGTVHATYEVADSQGNRTAGYVTIQVVAEDDTHNSAPRPQPITARVIAGNTVRIPVPLDGIDPDGDSVDLLGQRDAPKMGRVTVGDTWLNYEAYPDSAGRDSFTYVVRDRRGAEAVGTVVVGIAPPSFQNQAPYAATDTVTAKPGRTLSVPVLANDSDPDGDPILLVTEGLTVPDGLSAKVTDGRVLVTGPGRSGQYTLRYTVADIYGSSSVGSLVLDIKEDAPAQRPLARDDYVTKIEMYGKTSVDVPVLANDEDPDGVASDLRVSTDDPNTSVGPGGTVNVRFTEASQVILYTVANADGLTASAFVHVPGLKDLRPELSVTKPLEVKSGETLTISLADVVKVRDGRIARIATADSVSTSHSNGAPLLKDEHTFSYTSAADYYGPDTLTVQVTDGTGPDDASGLSSTISIPIQVIPAQNVSPTLLGTTIEVAPGEAEIPVNLARLSRDPNPGDLDRLAYSLQGSPSGGFAARVEGQKLLVKADASAARGASEKVVVQVSDSTSAPTTATFTLTTVVSSRPSAAANDDVVADAKAGQKSVVDVLANDVNPFPETPLKVLGAHVDSGSGVAELEGDKVAITPSADFVGVMIVSYQVQDATNAPERQVEGHVTLTVRGKPGVPGVPSVSSIQDSTVVLSWTPPSNNGSSITGYAVSSAKGYSKACPSTTCTLDGLTNDVEYTFTVTATNDVGTSDPSPASAPARPDARPEAPLAPSLVFGDKKVSVAWTTPTSHGSPVTSYTLEISPAPAYGSVQKTGVAGNSMEWEGLENGVAYQVRVQANNRAPEPSAWSPYSASVIPAGVPDAPAPPTTSPSTAVGSQAQILVTWAPPNANGDPVADYTLSVRRGGAVVNSLTLAGTSQNVTVDTSESDYSFSVTARNKAGASAPSADSAPRRAANAPSAPVSVTATEGDRNSQVSFTPGPLNGNRPNEISWRWKATPGGLSGSFGSATTGTITGLANGTSYTIQVWGESTVQGVAPGPATSSNPVNPYGSPLVRNLVGVGGDGTVSFNWSVDGNGRNVTGVQVNTSAGSTSGGAGLTSYTASGLGPSQTVNASVTVTTDAADAARKTASGSASATSNPVRLSISRGNPDSRKAGTYFLQLNYANLPAGNYTLQCYANETLGGTTPYDSWSGFLNGTGNQQVCGKADWQSGWYEIRLSGPYSATVHQNV
ncbi:Ig-like domain-containing protein [Arthrobacter sp. OV608]|uniref:Ig-like domain-containing protein n=1 Tax=Arthrobacter sp. OV608 TaxID=1882768 RepID=UPI0008CAB445|nr:Ig-like domain-containing protein [Arthrobacter sp. OV608]SEQ81267.1 Fibronectin type III domain-containing protein [Arthrobacter sp. OV608]